MLKSDKQMDRIKGKIISEQVRIKKFEEKKQKLQSIKFNKAVSILYYLYFINIRLKIVKIKRKQNLKRNHVKELKNGRNVNNILLILFRY
jgi:hypothetical protein